MSRGTVKNFDPDQGYGAIIDGASGRQLVVYANYVKLGAGSILKQGQLVEYDLEDHGMQCWAVNVREASPQS